MTLVPFTTCCLLLDVDPKTLRLWLTSARLSCTRSPTDTRLKCLTPSQLHQLAELHGRFLPDRLPGETDPPACSPISTPASAQAASPQDRARTFSRSEPTPEADLRLQLTVLQAHVACLQEHVTQLALALVRQQQWQWEQRAASCLPPLPSPVASSPPAPPAGRIAAVATPSALPESDRPRSRSRALPLIEEGADGHFVLISPTQGVLPLIPDSPEWFDWLSSLNAFSFQSQHGRFSATRKFRNGHRIQAWTVHCSLHGRSCGLYLGLTPTLTLARLQEMAAAVHARLTTL
jgi:hypothetical protein